MLYHSNTSLRMLFQKIKAGDITFAGNKILKTYGLLSCKAGKRMKKKNRVFFISEEEAIANAYRPCGSCMKEKYVQYKQTLI